MGLLDFARRTLSSILTPSPRAMGGGGWINIVREPYTGAWQNNEELRADTALSYSAVFAVVTLIAQDVGKMTLGLVEKDDDGIWTDAVNPAYSPVLRKPNRYQTTIKFVESWITSKLVHGNTYVLKARDARGVVNALYILDPTKVVPLIAPDGAVYYQLGKVEAGRPEQLAGVDATSETPVVPASEIIHDRMICLFHHLVGVSPLYACGVSALQGQTIQGNSSRFFANGSNPGGILVAPGPIDDAQAARLKKRWEERYSGPENIGRVAVMGDGLKYEPLTMSAVDAQLIDQLHWTAETICSAYHVPPYMVGIGAPPPYANVEPLVQLYYAACLQSLIRSFQTSLDEGLELPTHLGTRFNLPDLILMDAATRTKAAHDAIAAGALSPNESRRLYFGLGPVPGGDSPLMQQQYWSLAVLGQRDPPGAAAPTPPQLPEPDPDDADDFEAAYVAVQRAMLSEGLMYDA
jgi:HK97 family phage portal protein